MQSVAPEELEALFKAAKRQLDRERNRTLEELEALEAFEAEIRSIRTESPAVETGSVVVSMPSGKVGTKLQTVREAYESTVMAVSHYTEEYDDTYPESLFEEFGPDVATALLQRQTFDEHCKRATIAAASEAQTQRRRLRSALETESESLTSARSRLLSLLEEATTFTDESLMELSFETLDAYRARLSVLEDRCETLAATRQSTLQAQRRSLWLSIDDPDFATYAYQSLDVEYPILSAIARTADRIDEVRTHVERAIGYCN